MTSAIRDATSSNIADYNKFVNDVADAAGTPISGVAGKSSIADIQWKAIASTFTTDAIDNIGGPDLIPIFRPDSVGPVAGGTTTSPGGLFSGNISLKIRTTELGGDYAGYLWTGTQSDGTANPGHYMASTDPRLGYTTSIFSGHWICSGTIEYHHNLNPIYAISEELTVVPVPGALLIASTGLLSSLLGVNRLRRKR